MTTGMSVETSEAAWEATFRRWARPLSDSEEAMADNAASVIRSALNAYAPLSNVNFEVYATGSYRNNTNVRGESDIDVATVCHEMFYYELPMGTVASSFGLNTPAIYTFDHFRADVRAALVARFGSGMTPGDKAFNVHENTYRLEADVTPFCEYRRYTGAGAFDEGVKSVSRSGQEFVNWHADHYAQGVRRNSNTGRRFKRLTRILKNVKFAMLEDGSAAAKLAAKAVPSFLVECLMFNASDNCFGLSNGYARDVRAAIADLWVATKPEERWRDMLEVNCRKWLFRGPQPWTRDVAHTFLAEAWGYLFNE